MDIYNEGGSVGKRRKNKKNNSRKVGRNFRWDGQLHSSTKYRLSGNREKNKARRAAQRSRHLKRLKDLRNGFHFKDDRPKEAANLAEGSGPT